MPTARSQVFLLSMFVVTGCMGEISPGSVYLGGGGDGRNDGKGEAGRTAEGGSNGSGGTRSMGGHSGLGGVTGSGGDNAPGGVTGGGGFGAGSIARGGTGGTGGSIGSAGIGAAGTGNAQGTGGAGAKGGTSGGTSGGAGMGAGNNVVPVIVDSGPGEVGTKDVPFISVTVCVPGTATCATIDHVSVDTGSTGLRLIASVLPSNLKLPQQMTGGRPETECFTFADGYVWGSVRLADVKIGGESARNMQLQIIGDPAYPTVPSECQATGTPENTVADFGANGIIGISQSPQDCGSFCTKAGPTGYYACQGTSCTGVAMPVANQLANPVTLFDVDNNGAILEFPAVPETGAATLSGTLTFGVGTQANNALGNARTLTVDSDNMLTTVYGGTTMPESFIDSGTNLLAFTDKSLTRCTGQDAEFYCPSSTVTKMATITGRNNVSTPVTFSVANTDALLRTQFSAFDDLAGGGINNSFDWGFPFFIGRKVFIGFALPSSPGGTGYLAY
jgi:hypothetical protein